MKKIIGIVRDQLQEDVHPISYSLTALFLVVCIGLNYRFNFETNVIGAYDRVPYGIFVYFLYYAFAYYPISALHLLAQGKTDVLTSKEYWMRSGFFLMVTAFSSSFYFHHLYENASWTSSDDYYFRKIGSQLKSSITTFLPLVLFWWFTDKESGSFYGLRFKDVHLKPYWIMLAGMSVLVFFASFGDDFQYTYPIFKSWRMQEEPFGLSLPVSTALFEGSYAFSFFAVELLFRGAFIIGMARLLGKDALLPMVSLYAVLHFGKPLGETIGSVFGGYILGSIALRTRHILGGCIIHVGIAVLMELFAWWHYLR